MCVQCSRVLWMYLKFSIHSTSRQSIKWSMFVCFEHKVVVVVGGVFYPIFVIIFSLSFQWFFFLSLSLHLCVYFAYSWFTQFICCIVMLFVRIPLWVCILPFNSLRHSSTWHLPHICRCRTQLAHVHKLFYHNQIALRIPFSFDIFDNDPTNDVVNDPRKFSFVRFAFWDVLKIVCRLSHMCVGLSWFGAGINHDLLKMKQFQHKVQHTSWIWEGEEAIELKRLQLHTVIWVAGIKCMFVNI